MAKPADDKQPLRRGMLFILSAPSGCGKSSLVRELCKDLPLKHAISATTRAPRSGEIEGKDYYFFSQEQFNAHLEKQAFIEWAQVHGHYYGSLREPIFAALEAGQDIILDIDFQGVKQLQERFRQDVVSIFLLPPSMAEIKNRLLKRASDSPATIELRLTNAKQELNYAHIYDYLLINDDFYQCLAQIKMIYQAEALKFQRQLQSSQLLAQLLQQ